MPLFNNLLAGGLQATKPGMMGRLGQSVLGAAGIPNPQQGIGPSQDMLMQLLPMLIQQWRQKNQAVNAPGKLGQGIFNRANEPMQFPMQPMPNNQPVMQPNTSFAPTSNFATTGQGMSGNEMRGFRAPEAPVVGKSMFQDMNGNDVGQKATQQDLDTFNNWMSQNKGKIFF